MDVQYLALSQGIDLINFLSASKIMADIGVQWSARLEIVMELKVSCQITW